jgi:hypothetical protein
LALDKATKGAFQKIRKLKGVKWAEEKFSNIQEKGKEWLAKKGYSLEKIKHIESKFDDINDIAMGNKSLDTLVQERGKDYVDKVLMVDARKKGIQFAITDTKTGQVYHAYYVDPITHKSTLIISKNNNETNLISDKNNSPMFDKGADREVVELNSGKKRNWNKELNNLKPNTIYRVDDRYDYHTDEYGRVSKVEGTLDHKTMDRNTYQQCKAGRCGESGDEGGHLIASIFAGPGEGLNILPMNANLNKGEWKKLENSWANALKEGKKVEVKIEPVYLGDGKRPDGFNVLYKIGKEKSSKVVFNNAPGGKQL